MKIQRDWPHLRQGKQEGPPRSQHLIRGQSEVREPATLMVIFIFKRLYPVSKYIWKMQIQCELTGPFLSVFQGFYCAFLPQPSPRGQHGLHPFPTFLAIAPPAPESLPGPHRWTGQGNAWPGTPRMGNGDPSQLLVWFCCKQALAF